MVILYDPANSTFILGIHIICNAMNTAFSGFQPGYIAYLLFRLCALSSSSDGLYNYLRLQIAIETYINKYLTGLETTLSTIYIGNIFALSVTAVSAFYVGHFIGAALRNIHISEIQVRVYLDLKQKITQFYIRNNLNKIFSSFGV